MSVRRGRGGAEEQRYTILVVPERPGPVRRLRVSRAAMRRFAVGLVAAALAGGAVTADWVRLRLQAVDVERLRAETDQQRRELLRLSGELSQVERHLARVRELERKVRIIANLPKTIAEHPTRGNAVTEGRGGDEEESPEATAPGPQLREGSKAADPAARGEAPLVRQLSRARTHARRLASALAAERGSLADVVEGLERVRARLASTPSIWPVRGWISSGFGRRLSPFTGRVQFHAGLDISAEYGAEVVAPARGRVVFAGRKGPLGRAVVIDHGYGIRTTYGHLSKIEVRRGQHVERGQTIGRVGSTGRATGPHLHYTIAVHGKAVDPRDFLFD